jgi:hypothetical protein
MVIDEWAPAATLSIMFLSVASIFVLRGPLGRALAERLAGRRVGADGAEQDRLQAEVDELKHRLEEAEERLDFTERVLARAPDAAPLAPPR